MSLYIELLESRFKQLHRAFESPLASIRAFGIAALALVLQACSTLVPLPPSAVGSADRALAAYNEVLAEQVNERGEVNFAAIAAAPQKLERYLVYVAATPLAQFTDTSQKLAHLINAYNALSMYNVVRAGLPTSHAGFRKVGFFVLRKHQVGGQSISLYDLENSIIRPLGDARVHFALNCSARACPTLPRKAFTAQNLNAELEAETKAFFAAALHLRVDHNKREVWVSEILKFYTEDFVPAGQSDPTYRLIDYINRYSAQPVPKSYELKFIPYDWTVAHWAK